MNAKDVIKASIDMGQFVALAYVGDLSDSDLNAFCSKEKLLRVAAEQRAGTFAALAEISEADLDLPTGIPYCPTKGEQLLLQGGHWLMHCGQWAVVRRQLGKPPLF